MAPTTLVVLAAGIGSRYGGLKQIDPVGPNGEIIISYSIYDAIRAGFDKVVFLIRKDIEKDFRETVGRTIEKQVDTQYAFQELDMVPDGFQIPPERAKPWGTAHAVLSCRDVVDSPFGVINADDFYGREAYQLLADFLKQSSNDSWEYALIGYILKNTLSLHGHVARGVCTTSADGYLEDVVERTKIQIFGDQVKYTEDGETWHETPPDGLVSMNMWGFTKTFLDEAAAQFPAFLEQYGNEPKSEFLLPTVISDLLNRDTAKVKVLPTEELWYGVTYKEDKPKVVEAIRALVADGRYPEKLF